MFQGAGKQVSLHAAAILRVMTLQTVQSMDMGHAAARRTTIMWLAGHPSIISTNRVRRDHAITDLDVAAIWRLHGNALLERSHQIAFTSVRN